MSFKWIYVAAAVLFATGVIISLPFGGIAGGLSHIYAIGLVGVGGVLVLLARRTQSKPPMSGEDVPFTGYPEQQVVGILDSRDEAAEAIRELRRDNVAGDLTVYRGDEGTTAIDSEGVAHGLPGVVERQIQHLVADLDDMANYDDAVRVGKIVLAFDGSDEETRRHGTEILRAHGGHTIQYFGGMTVEKLDVDRSRTTT